MIYLVMAMMLSPLLRESPLPCLIDAQVSQGVLLPLLSPLLRESQLPCLIDAQVSQGVLLPQGVVCVHNLGDPDHRSGHIYRVVPSLGYPDHARCGHIFQVVIFILHFEICTVPPFRLTESL